MSIFDALRSSIENQNDNSAGGADKCEKMFSFNSLPRSAEELKSHPVYNMQDPFAVAAMAVAVLCVYPSDKESAIEMLNVLRGPRPLSPMDKQFIRDRFMDGKDYVPRSYFNGATPENDYTPSEPCTITISERAHSRDNFSEGYITLYIHSGGADSERPISLRNKPSTGEWFLWQHEGLLAGIRVPKSSDPWA